MREVQKSELVFRNIPSLGVFKCGCMVQEEGEGVLFSFGCGKVATIAPVMSELRVMRMN